MLDALIALAKDKSPRGLKQTMRESAVVQSDVGELEARLRATRHYLLGTLAEVWDMVQRTQELTVEQRMAIRLASSRTIHESRDVANACYHAAGATAVFSGNPFERRFRDMHAIVQQLQGRRAHYETVGKFLLGLDADTAFL